MQASDKNRKSSVENALNQIHRQFGKGSIMRLGSREAELVPAIPTGALSLDIALGVGGLPRGRVTEIYGPESSGKTTLALHAIAEAQKRGGQAAFIDAEHALDTSYAERLGVNIDDLLVSQPDFGEQALEIAEILIRSGGVDTIVALRRCRVDSAPEDERQRYQRSVDLEVPRVHRISGPRPRGWPRCPGP